MFADTQLYDNMIRLVQFIGYNPRGCIPAQFTGVIKVKGLNEDVVRNITLPKFTYFVTQKSGKNGNVCFSIVDGIKFESDVLSEDGLEGV